MIPVIRFAGLDKVVFLDPSRKACLKSGAPTNIRITSRNLSPTDHSDEVIFTLLVRIDDSIYIGSLADGRLAALHPIGHERCQFYITGEPVPDGIRRIRDKVASTTDDPPAACNPLNQDDDIGPEHNVPDGAISMAVPDEGRDRD